MFPHNHELLYESFNPKLLIWKYPRILQIILSDWVLYTAFQPLSISSQFLIDTWKFLSLINL